MASIKIWRVFNTARNRNTAIIMFNVRHLVFQGYCMRRKIRRVLKSVRYQNGYVNTPKLTGRPQEGCFCGYYFTELIIMILGGWVFALDVTRGF